MGLECNQECVNNDDVMSIGIDIVLCIYKYVYIFVFLLCLYAFDFMYKTTHNTMRCRKYSMYVAGGRLGGGGGRGVMTYVRITFG